jgi:hypothetical protein
MAEQVANNAVSALAAGISNSATTLTVTTGHGSKFPSTGNFRLGIGTEILKATARSGDVITVVRGQESTTAASHALGDEVRQVLTKAGLAQLILDAVTESGLNIQDYGAVGDGSTNDYAAIQAAYDAAGTAGASGRNAKVIIPAGKLFCSQSQINSKNLTMTQLDGDLKCTASSVLADAFFLVQNGASQVKDGGIRGSGRIYGNAKCTWALRVNSARGGRFRDFVVGDGTLGGVIVSDTNAIDTDSLKFDGVTQRCDPSLFTGGGGDARDLPLYGFKLDGTAGRVTDSTLVNCNQIGGLRAESSAGANDGGIAYELLNAERLHLEDNMFASHVLYDNGTSSLGPTYAYKIRSDSTIYTQKSRGQHTITNPYTEVAPQTGVSPMNSSWHFWNVHISTGADWLCEWNEISGAKMGVSGSHAVRLETVVGTGTAGVDFLKYLAPKNNLGSLANGIILGVRSDNCLIQVNIPAEVAYVDDNGGAGTNNNVVALVP